MMVGGARVRRIVPRLLLAVAIDALARQGTVSPVAMADAAARVPAAPRHTRAELSPACTTSTALAMCRSWPASPTPSAARRPRSIRWPDSGDKY
jgi:hypothetical protein